MNSDKVSVSDDLKEIDVASIEDPNPQDLVRVTRAMAIGILAINNLGQGYDLTAGICAGLAAVSMLNFEGSQSEKNPNRMSVAIKELSRRPLLLSVTLSYARFFANQVFNV